MCTAQILSNKRIRYISTIKDTTAIDTLSLIGDSFKITNQNIGPENYQLIAEKGLIVWKRNMVLPDSVQVEYNVFSTLLTKKYRHKSIDLMQVATNNFVNPYTLTYEKKGNEIFQLEGLNKSGSITRGVSFGNNQDVVLNSNLNLQLSGKISNQISIKAALADDNIPIQPEGNTQQLQEFDKVYIQLNDDKSQLIAGDFVLNKPPSYFLTYYKRAQGGSFNTAFNTKGSKKSKIQVDAAFAVSKGKFSRNKIQGIEGNQGPYRLQGADNEAFIIVLSGTELIYIDGQLLQRGQENDYIIDYNTAQITFTAKKLITKDKRIVAEFQYADRNYARSIITFGQDNEIGKWRTHFHVYTEQDNKNKPLNLTLTPDQKNVLRNVGDSINQAFAPRIDTVAFSENEILYAERDTIVNGITYNKIFVYSTNSSVAKYRPSFSNVGNGNGNYKNITSSVNGKLYQWFAPVDGVKQGNFEPVILLPTPKQKQMAVASASYAINKQTNTGLELAISNNDVNTFSSIGNANNQGYGIKYLIDHKSTIGDSTNRLYFIAAGNYEMISKYFSPIERFRSVEFDRDWNRSSTLVNSIQHIASASIGLQKNETNKILYKLNTFQETAFYNGIQHVLNGSYKNRTTKINFDGSLLNSKGNINTNRFLRQKGLLSQAMFKKKLIVGVSEEQEKSSFFDLVKDTLEAQSFHYLQLEAFAMNGDSTTNSFEIRYINRRDWKPKNNEFTLANTGESVNFATTLNISSNSTFKNTTTYRILKINDETLLAQNDDKSLVNRIEYNFRLLKGSITSATFYELGSGQEVKKEYSFVEVAAGQGSYTWKDYNDNGVKELNEFEISVFNDQAKYIKVFTPTNEFIKTFNNQFNEILNINAPSKWTVQKKTLRKLISRFSNQTAFRTDTKTTNSSIEKSLNPFKLFNANSNNEIDSNLVTLNSNIRTTFYFNRLGTIFGLDYTYQNPRSRQLLVNGFESRGNESNGIRLRYNFTRIFMLSGELLKGKKSNSSSYFNTRDYVINYYEAEPKFTYQPSPAFKAIVSFKYSDKKNVLNDSNRVATNQNFGLELRYNQATKGSFTAKINYIKIDYDGVANSSIAFEMLEGLVPGNNATWNLSYQRTLANNLQLSFNYDGRKTEGNKAIHTGGVQVRAFF